MLLASVAGKTARDRTPLAVFVGMGLAVFAFVMVLVAANLEAELDDITADLPEAFTGLIGGEGTNYALAELFGLLAPIAVLVIAIGGGVGALAGEERRRTADLLLTQPVTRRHVVLSKAAVLTVNIAITCAIFLAGCVAAESLIDLEGFGPGDALAATVHLLFLGLAFGMIALLAANATGSTAAGIGLAAGLALVSNVAAGLLPLVDGLEGVAKVSPWYYYNGANPLGDGVAPAHLAVLGSLALAAFALAVVVVDHRDIGSRRSGPRISIPAVNAMGRPHVGGVLTKTLTDHLVLMGVTAASLAGMAVAISAMYSGLADTLTEFSESFPDSVKQLLGASDFGTPAGWVQVEMLSLMTPIALIAVAVVMGVGAIAGEDGRRTLGLLVATPTRRSRIVLEKAVAMVIAVTLVAVVCWLGLVAGSALGGLDLGLGHLGGAVAHIALLAIFFGTLALAVGAASSSGVAFGVTAAAAVVAYFGDWLLGLQDGLEDFAIVSPWHYASAAEPLTNGADFTDLGVLAASSLIATLAAAFLFGRRELNA